MNFMNFFISLKYLPRINDAGRYEMVRYFKQYYLGGGGELLVINYKISVKYVEWRVVDRPVRGRCVNYFCHCRPWRSFYSNATKDDLVQARSSLSHIQWKRYKDILKMQRIFGDRTLISGKKTISFQVRGKPITDVDWSDTKVGGISLRSSQLTHLAEFFPGLFNKKQLGVILFLPGWDISPFSLLLGISLAFLDG